MTETAELKPSNETVDDFFGWSVCVSGNRIVVGAPQATVDGNDFKGRYIYIQGSLQVGKVLRISQTN
jgi:hypothetical protein